MCVEVIASQSTVVFWDSLDLHAAQPEKCLIQAYNGDFPYNFLPVSQTPRPTPRNSINIIFIYLYTWNKRYEKDSVGFVDCKENK